MTDWLFLIWECWWLSIIQNIVLISRYDNYLAISCHLTCDKFDMVVLIWHVCFDGIPVLLVVGAVVVVGRVVRSTLLDIISLPTKHLTESRKQCSFFWAHSRCMSLEHGRQRTSRVARSLIAISCYFFNLMPDIVDHCMSLPQFTRMKRRLAGSRHLRNDLPPRHLVIVGLLHNPGFSCLIRIYIRVCCLIRVSRRIRVCCLIRVSRRIRVCRLIRVSRRISESKRLRHRRRQHYQSNNKSNNNSH